MAWLYLPEQVDWNSDSKLHSEIVTDVSPTWKEASKPLQFWQRTWDRVDWMKLLSGMIFPPLQAMSFAHSWIKSTLSQRASRVSRGVGQGLEEKPTTSVGSGTISGDWLLKYDPDTFSWRTRQVSLFTAELEPFSETFPKSGSMQNGFLYERATSGHHIDAKEFSFWPTVTTQEIPHYDMELNHKGRRIPKKGNTDHSMNLEDSARLWGSPRASEWKGTGPLGSASYKHRLDRQYLDAQSEDFHHRLLTGKPGQQSLENDQTSLRRQLNPKFVEWLMGFPEGWLDLSS